MTRTERSPTGSVAQQADWEPRRRLSAAVLATWVAVAMVVLLPVALIAVTPAPRGSVWLGVLVVTTIAGARYAWIVGDGRRRLVEMSFWVFTYVFLGIAPLVQLRTGATPETTPRIDGSLTGTTVVIVVVGVLAFAAGSTVSPRRMVGLRLPYVLTGTDTRRSVVFSLFALLFAAYFVSKVGVGTLFASRDELSARVQSIWPESATAAFVGAVSSMSLLVAFIALVKCLYQARSRDWALVLLTVVVGLVLVVTLNPISSARYVFGTAALAVAALFGLFATPGRFRFTAILAVFALIVVFPLADAFRNTTTAEFDAGSPLDSLTSADYDAFGQINNTVLYVERHGTTQGRQAAGVALFWVPRSIWPDKPKDTGIVLAEDRGYAVTNLSAPFWSEMFINGGWVVLVLGLFGLGMLARVQDQRIEESLRRARDPAILACILPFYLIILLRGSLLQAMSYLLVIVGSAVFVTRWSRRSAE